MHVCNERSLLIFGMCYLACSIFANAAFLALCTLVHAAMAATLWLVAAAGG